MERTAGARNPPWLVAGFLSLVWVASVAAYAPLGFNPTDDGLILAQASRILDGMAPHRQIASPRPLGSPLLHVFDVLLPTPLVFTSRAVALLEVLLTAVLVVRLLTGRGFRRWGAREAILASLAFVVNLHTFPLLSWHTIDGLFVAAVALAAVEVAYERRNVGLVAVGAVIGGFAPLIKQSFAPVPILVLGWVIWRWRPHRHETEFPGWGRLVAAVATAAVPIIAYTLWVLGTGSGDAALDQVLGASGVRAFAGIRGSAVLIVTAIAGLAVAAAMVIQRRRSAGDPEDPLTRFVPLASLLLVVALVSFSISSLVLGGLVYEGSWGRPLWWLAAISALVWSASSGSVDLPSVAVLSMAWMASLSWGYPVPSLAGGSLLLVVVVRGGQLAQAAVPHHSERIRNGLDIGIVALAALMVVMSGTARFANVYRDVPASQQSEHLGAWSRDLWGVRTNAVTAGYLKSIKTCTERYPSAYLAVLPDNAVVPLLLGKKDPFSVDWWYLLEVPSNHEALFDQAERAERHGDVLVLFQTIPVGDLAGMERVQAAEPDSTLFDYGDHITGEIRSHLHGQPITCGPFVGNYTPSR